MKQLGKKIIALTYLTTILFSLFFPFNKSFAEGTLTTSSLKPTSVTLNGKGLGLFASIIFRIDITDPTNTPKYSKLQNATSDGYGNASSSFSGLSPGGKYVGMAIEGNYVDASVNFTTPTTPGSSDFPSSLIVSADKPSSKLGDTVVITAKFDKSTNAGMGKTIFFSSVDNEDALYPKTCTMPTSPVQIQSCFINFKSIKEGAFNIKADVTIDSTSLSGTVSPIVGGCVDPKQVLIDGICTTPITLVPGDKTPPVNTDTTYTPLAPLPGLPETPFQTDAGCKFDEEGNMIPGSCTNPCPFGNYLNIMIKLVIGIAAVLAMVMIVMGGIEYMTSDLISSKEAGKDTIKNALLGLLIALGAYLILNTINPKLLSACLDNLPQATITIKPLYDRGYNDPKQPNGESTRCTPVLSGPCSVANLTPIFGDKAVAMSKICNMESGGSSIQSGTDVCKPGNNSFSFGLFQVNLAANGKLAGADCVGLFDRAVSSKDAIEPKYTSGFRCSLLSGKETLYSTCKARLLNTDTNLAIAKSLFLNSKGMENWSGDKRFCASAFK